MEQKLKKPQWLKTRLSTNDNFLNIRNALRQHNLNTVCTGAHCPNISECWNRGTATFMIMGDVCTRGCRFCAVRKGRPKKLDENEPKKIADALASIGIFDYVVLTSVTRDDLQDGGASHFAGCISEIKRAYPEIIVEALIPDFNADILALGKVIGSNPDVIAHNIETVERLQKKVRDARAGYRQSLKVLENAKKINPHIRTKSSIMLGLGETDLEVMQAMKDLRSAKVGILTLGQYLQPTENHIPVSRFVEPSEFGHFRHEALKLGFSSVASGPFVRSSYKARDFFSR